MPKKIGLLTMTVYCIFLFLDVTSSDEIFPHFIYIVLHPYGAFWDSAVAWSGKHLLGLHDPITIKPNGSGDTTYNYVMQLLWVLLALLIATIWAVLDRKRPSYNQLYRWLRISIRYYFAYTLMIYGFVKIIKLQFPFPSLYKLVEPFGNSSPMGLAWSFIGYSKGYNLFTGSAECIAGILLLFRRTTLLGSILALTIMTNVAAMNLAYDIPVKIFSLNLVFLAVFLIAHDAKRLKAFFFQHSAIPAAELSKPINKRWKKIAQPVLKIAFVIFAFYFTVWSDLNMAKTYGDESPKPPLYGIYNIETFTCTKTNNPNSTPSPDSVCWKKFIVAYSGYARIMTKADSMQNFECKIDTLQKTAAFTSSGDSSSFTLAYTEPDKNHLLFTGLIHNDSVHISMRRFDLNNFRLISRGFHWVNEYPYNR